MEIHRFNISTNNIKHITSKIHSTGLALVVYIDIMITAEIRTCITSTFTRETILATFFNVNFSLL